jgi:hypothetical protein
MGHEPWLRSVAGTAPVGQRRRALRTRSYLNGRTLSSFPSEQDRIHSDDRSVRLAGLTNRCGDPTLFVRRKRMAEYNDVGVVLFASVHNFEKGYIWSLDSPPSFRDTERSSQAGSDFVTFSFDAIDDMVEAVAIVDSEFSGR